VYGLGQLVCAPKPDKLKQVLWHWIPALVIALSVAFFNPFGSIFLLKLLDGLQMARPHISEWKGLFFRPYFNPYLIGVWSVMLMLWGLQLLRLRRETSAAEDRSPSDASTHFSRLSLAPALVLATVLLMTYKALRFQSFLGMTSVAYLPLLASILGSYRFPDVVKHWASKAVFPLSVVVPLGLLLCMPLQLSYMNQHRLPLTLATVPDELTWTPNPPFPYPVIVLRFLQQSNMSGNLMVPFNMGQFAYWVLYPKFKISMDGRYECVYDDGQETRQWRFYNMNYTRDPSKAYQLIDARTDFILFPVQSPNKVLFRRHPDWVLIYGNGYYEVYGRKRRLPMLLRLPPDRDLYVPHFYGIQDFMKQGDLKRFEDYPFEPNANP
jgi:hypothetical protein